MSSPGDNSIQKNLDTNQYNRHSILRYERIFGDDFLSTGGKETTEEFVPMLSIKPGEQVLDVGSGIGGSAFYMSNNFGAHVTGIDLSTNMVEIATERMKERDLKNVSFEVADATTHEFEAGSFDVIYSRDTILHIQDKQSLFASFLRWLKPGGRLLISDYCCSEDEHTEEFTEYIEQRGYFLLSPKQYGKILEDAGFGEVRVVDKTDSFIGILKKELAQLEPKKNTFLNDFTHKDFENLVEGWNKKLVRCGRGEQRWGLFMAKKVHPSA